MTEPVPVTFVAHPAAPNVGANLADATASVVFRSAGACLVIGPLEAALDAVAALPSLSCTIVRLDPSAGRIEKRLLDTGAAVFDAVSLELRGHLGDYVAIARAADAETDLAVATWRESGRFDLVLDLQETPRLGQRLAPLGYRHLPPGTQADEVAAALAELDGLVGEFDKPRYFDWQADLCAHSRSSLLGCNRCIEVCAPEAIRPAGDGVTVDPYLCQGCGSCATVCPSGAMRYAYPPVSDAVRRTRELVDGAEATPVDTLVLHVEAHEDAVRAAALPPSVLDLAVEEVTAFGLDYWLGMAASGIGRIVLVLDAPEDDPGRRALQAQAALFERLLGGLDGIASAGPVLHFSSSDGLAGTLADSAPNTLLVNGAGARFDVQDAKRQTVRAALDVLAERHAASDVAIALPAGSPFGRVALDQAACTLCMACVSICPAGALLDGRDRPALRFIEANCVQCGLCEKACPEDAIGLEARYLYDSVTARKTEVLNEEEPFHCLRCHKAFATQGVIRTMIDKLADHWMFEDPKALRRLKMCEDCRVKDLFENQPGGMDVHRGAGDEENSR